MTAANTLEVDLTLSRQGGALGASPRMKSFLKRTPSDNRKPPRPSLPRGR